MTDIKLPLPPHVSRANGITIMSCDDPQCGPHIVALDANGEPICEIVVSQATARKMIEWLQTDLYAKAVRRH